jgi:hypothetical protein
MGGFGSGRHSNSSTPSCESMHSIDLASLRRRGMLEPGRISTVTWSVRGERMGEISLIAQENGVRLLYHITGRDGAKTSIDEIVSFAYTATMFDGRRQWLLCRKCGRRCRVIYGGRYFRCRQCHGLTYASRNESPAQRAMHRADRIANRLHDMWKGTMKAKVEFPPKPSRMRWRTYMRLKLQYDELRGRWLAGVMGRFGTRRGAWRG